MCHVSYEQTTSRAAFPAELTEKLSGLVGVDVLLGSSYEPTMNKGFAQIVRSLTRCGLRIELVTNGTLLHDDNLAALAEANVRLLVVSFDGASKAVYEHIRRRADYDGVIDSVRAARERLAPETLFVVNATVMRSNLEEIAASVALWDRERFDQIRFIAMVTRHPDMNAESLFPLHERYHANLDAAAEELIDARRRISMASPYFNASPLRHKYPDNVHGAVVSSGHPETRPIAELRAEHQLGAGPGMSWPCRSPWTFARILPNGDVELCFKWRVGNLRDQSFKDIWFGPKAAAVRRRVIKETSICPACDHYRLCLKGGSLDTAKAESYWINDDRAFMIERVGDYNIVAAKDRFLALHRALGEVDAPALSAGLMPGVLVRPSREAALAVAKRRSARSRWRRKAEAALARISGAAWRLGSTTRL
jgi:radical SAM protein with 4Fe4S-binding SPASM domain